MKIEKLTENKIRIILKQEDLEKKELDIQTLLSSTPTSQEFLLDILKTAKRKSALKLTDINFLLKLSQIQMMLLLLL